MKFTDERRWSDHVQDYYPVNPRPRFGYGQPSHPQLTAMLDRARPGYEWALDAVRLSRDVLHGIGHEARRRSEAAFGPTWNNVWFTALDAATLVAFLLARKPARYLEIGSGNSSVFARRAISEGGLQTELVSIDPNPRAEIDAICDKVIRKPLEECDLSVFGALAPGDILFFDGSHRIFTNSDVAVFFLEIMPRLRPGVLVHIHDIFLPDDYPPEWTGRLYSEQYLLAAQLLCGQPPFAIVLPNYFASLDALIAPRIQAVFAARGSGPDIPLRYPNRVQCPGTSFWLQTIAQPRAGAAASG
jgi:predicted O-methyltransferase YrrM